MMNTPAWINAVASEGTINEITHYIVDLHRQLHYEGIDSRPANHEFTTRQHYIDELVRLWRMLRAAEARIDVC